MEKDELFSDVLVFFFFPIGFYKSVSPFGFSDKQTV